MTTFLMLVLAAAICWGICTSTDDFDDRDKD